MMKTQTARKLFAKAKPGDTVHLVFKPKYRSMSRPVQGTWIDARTLSFVWTGKDAGLATRIARRLESIEVIPRPTAEVVVSKAKSWVDRAKSLVGLPV